MNIEKHYSWPEFLEYVDWKDDDILPVSKRSSHESGKRNWYGTESFAEALNLAKYGWTEKLSEIKQLELKEIPAYKQMYQTEIKYCMAGGSVNIGRFLMGIPDCMQRQVIRSGFNIPAGFAKVVVNASCNADVSVEKFFAYGMKISSVVNTLELANIRTEIILTEQTLKHSNSYRIFITLKNSEDSFYLEKLMFPVAHVSFQRRLCFSEHERNSSEVRNAFGFYDGGGYGQSDDEFDGADDKNTLYFNGIHFSPEKINAKLAAILANHQRYIS